MTYYHDFHGIISVVTIYNLKNSIWCMPFMLCGVSERETLLGEAEAATEREVSQGEDNPEVPQGEPEGEVPQ